VRGGRVLARVAAASRTRHGEQGVAPLRPSLAGATGIAVDSSGNIYVTNAVGGPAAQGLITIYPFGSNGNVSPTDTIGDDPSCCTRIGLDNPTGIALDSSANIYVTNAGTYTGAFDYITIYTAGSASASGHYVAPNAVINGVDTGLEAPSAIAVDSAANIYVTNQAGMFGSSDIITVYPAGSDGDTVPDISITGNDTGLSSPAGIAIDSSGNIYVTNQGSLYGSTDSVVVYPADSVDDAIPQVIIGSRAGIVAPSGIAEDSAGFVYVVNNGTASGGIDTVTIYLPGTYANSDPIASIAGIATGLASPNGIAVDSNGDVYVANASGGVDGSGSIAVYPAGVTGNGTPIAAIAGANTTLFFPSALSLDLAGEIYVTNPLGGPDLRGSVAVFAAGINGNVPPVATIVGANTGLDYPNGIATDASGKIYVANAGYQNGDPDTVTVYAAGSNGDVAPIATITGANTGLANPTGIALDSNGNIYVANSGGAIGAEDSVTVYQPGANGNASPLYIIYGGLTGLGAPKGIAIGLDY